MNAFDEEPVAIVVEPAVNIDAPVPGTPVMEQIPEVRVPVPVDTETAVTEPVGTEESLCVETLPKVSGQEEQPPVVEEEEDPTMPQLVAQDPAEAESDDEAEDEEEEEVPTPKKVYKDCRRNLV